MSSPDSPNVYLHVLASDGDRLLIDVFRNRHPSSGPLMEEAKAALMKCPAVFVGRFMSSTFGDTFGTAPRTPEEYAAAMAEYEQKKARYDQDVAAGRRRISPPEAPNKPRCMREPTFVELLREEIGRNLITITKALTRRLVESYKAAPSGVVPEVLEGFLQEYLGRTLFMVDWPGGDL